MLLCSLTAAENGLGGVETERGRHLSFPSLFCKALNNHQFKTDTKFTTDVLNKRRKGDDSLTGFMFIIDGFEHIIRCSLTPCQKS